MNIIRDILSEFDKNKDLFESFKKMIENLLLEILKEKNIPFHSVTSRVKDRESLEKKIKKNNNKYKSLLDITDVLGIRITTYFEDDISRISDLIEEEFDIDKDNSIDKRTLLEPDRFGYLSLHHIVSLSSMRGKLVENKRFIKLKIEIQTRSILQHAWAEIEHNLGYKKEQAIPKVIRRRFSRLAGLLELADQEFINIKTDLQTYENSLENKIKNSPETVLIDQSSILQFLKQNKLSIEIDSFIANIYNSKVNSLSNKTSIDHLISMLIYFEITLISDIEKKLSKNQKKVKDFAKNWLDNSSNNYFTNGISLFYLCYILIAENENIEKIRKFLSDFSIGDSEDIYNNASNILKIYSEITSTSLKNI